MESEERNRVIQARKDPEAFARLYDSNYPRVFNYLLYLTGDIDDALDLTSETFLKAFRSINKYSPTGAPFSAWLLKIASNEAKMLFRKRKRVRSIVPLDETVEIRKRLLEEEIAQADAQIRACEEFLVFAPVLRRLSRKYREVVFLRFYEEMSIEEISRCLGRPTGTVKAQLHRALKMLREKMQPTAGQDHYLEMNSGAFSEEAR